MRTAAAVKEFNRFLATRGQRVTQLSVTTAVESMLAFYDEVRADGVDLAQDGDMVLYQWGGGSHDGGVESFKWNLTRQFIVGEGEDDDIWQLSLTFFFAATPALAAVAQGDRWCHSPDKSSELRAFILSSPAYTAASEEQALRIDLHYESVG